MIPYNNQKKNIISFILTRIKYSQMKDERRPFYITDRNTGIWKSQQILNSNTASRCFKALEREWWLNRHMMQFFDVSWTISFVHAGWLIMGAKTEFGDWDETSYKHEEMSLVCGKVCHNIHLLLECSCLKGLVHCESWTSVSRLPVE